jgi:hypothetical protein
MDPSVELKHQPTAGSMSEALGLIICAAFAAVAAAAAIVHLVAGAIRLVIAD